MEVSPPAALPPRRSARDWISGSFWSVADQGLFAGANFFVNVLLARHLTPEAYGAFAVTYVTFLLVGGVHTGLFVEPMLVFGAGRFEGRSAAYLRVLLRGHLVYSVGSGLLLAGIGVVAWMAGSRYLPAEFLSIGAGAGAIIALWMLRRAAYIVDQQHWAAMAGALYVLVLAVGAFALVDAGRLNGPAAFGLMAVGSLASSVVLAWRFGLFASDAAPSAALAAEVRAAHAEYGRWAAPTGVLEWMHGALPMLVLPLFVGLAGSGTLRALYNLALPALQAFTALGVMAIPIFVRARVTGDLRRTATGVGGVILGLSLAYAAVLLAGGPELVRWFYDGKYAPTPAALWMLALLPVAAALNGVAMAWLRSEERPRDIFAARGAAVVSATTVGLALTRLFGVVGALASDVLSFVVEFAVQARAIGCRPAADARSSARVPTPDGRLRVLMSAFACYPHRGSEPAIGWHMVTEMARHHDVTVLTYTGWRAKIEAALAAEPVPGLTLEYVHVPGERAAFLRRGEHRTGLAEQLHYLLWQHAARRAARRLHARAPFHVGHHVTFGKYWAPTAFDGVGLPFVWGPVGGGESAPRSFYHSLGAAGRCYESGRDAGRRLSEWMPRVRRTAREATLALATTEASAARMRALGATAVEVRSGIGLPADELAALGALPPAPAGPVRFLCAGRVLAWKGFPLAVAAFGDACASGDPALDSAELWLVGDGPDRPALERAVAASPVRDRIRLLGGMARADLLATIAQAHVLVQPSLHDSGGIVCLEAMAARRPVLGMNLGGTPVHVTPACGLLVEPTSPAAAIRGLADGMRRLAADPAGRAAMGEAGHERVRRRFVWEDKAADYAALYAALVGAVPVPSGDGAAASGRLVLAS